MRLKNEHVHLLLRLRQWILWRRFINEEEFKRDNRKLSVCDLLGYADYSLFIGEVEEGFGR